MSHPPLKRRTRPSALADLVDGAKLYKTWSYLSYQDLISRYRRSFLGPFWIAAVMMTQAIALSLVFGTIYGLEVKSFLPYVIGGLTVINLIGVGFNEGSETFRIYSPMISAHPLPISFHVYRMVCRHFVMFLHNFAVFLAVWIFYNHNLALSPLIIPGLLLGLVFMTSTIFITACISMRYLDFKFMLPQAWTIVFYFTPVIWQPSQIKEHLSLIYQLNPIYYMLEVIRAPMLGHAVGTDVWLGATVVVLGTSILAYIVFASMRKKISLWL